MQGIILSHIVCRCLCIVESLLLCKQCHSATNIRADLALRKYAKYTQLTVVYYSLVTEHYTTRVYAMC